MKYFFKFIFLIAAFIVLTSCTVTENLSDDSSSTELKVSPFMIDLMEDLSCWIDNGKSDAIMDNAISSFAENLIYSGSASEIYTAKETDGTYKINFSFDNLNRLIDRLTMDPDQDIVVFTENGGKTKLEINLNIENYSTLAKAIPVLSDPNLEVYGPVYNNPPYESKTEKDYLFMIDFIFGSGSQDIKNSVINLNYTAPSEITNSNGTAKDNTVSFSIPLIDFLLLHEPVYLFCEW